MADANEQMRTAAAADRVPDIVIITGMSGSGRTQAMHVFEDMGYYCIDNLPPRLVLDLASLVGINTGVGRHLAVTCDLRAQGLFDELTDALAQLEQHELTVKVLFLDCSDEVLMRRYKETRRRHPIAGPGESLESAIARERAQLAGVRERADLVLDTSHMRTAALGSRIRRSFLPNPFYDPEMRTLTGNDEKVATYVLGNDVTKRFLEAWRHLLDVVMPGYVAEGKSQLSIAVGCTGGQHRSVAIANVTADYLTKQGYHVTLSHRNLPHGASAR